MISLTLTPEIKRLSRRYTWWQEPAEAIKDPPGLLCRIMEVGTWDDAQSALQELGEDAFKEVLKSPPPGIFHARSWNYWHIRFGLNPIPELPKRRF